MHRSSPITSPISGHGSSLLVPGTGVPFDCESSVRIGRIEATVPLPWNRELSNRYREPTGGENRTSLALEDRCPSIGAGPSNVEEILRRPCPGLPASCQARDGSLEGVELHATGDDQGLTHCVVLFEVEKPPQIEEGPHGVGNCETVDLDCV